MLRTIHWTGLMMIAGLMAGCAHMYDVKDEHMLKWRCCHEAKVAWLRCRDLYAEVCYPYDFGAGFRAGYESVCMGGNGCPPAMPPRNYWSACCHGEAGNCQVMAWYDGFHHGVLAAQCDGCEGGNHIVCAQDLYGQKPCEVDYNDIEVHVQPEGHPGPVNSGPSYPAPLAPVPSYGPEGMPYEPPASSPTPVVPDYSPPPAAGLYRGDFSAGSEVSPPTIPGLRDMLNQNADADQYPTF